jgi:hypothetical protein
VRCNRCASWLLLFQVFDDQQVIACDDLWYHYYPGRILRVLRIFRMKHIMRRYADNAVMEAASKLGITLLSILLISAGMYYELEKYGVSQMGPWPDHAGGADQA